MGVHQGLDVGGVFLVDPGGEVALGLVHLAGPGGPVIHIHGHLYVVAVLLHAGQVADLLEAGVPGLAGGHAAVDGDGAGVGHGAAAGGGVEDLGGGAGAPAQEAGVLKVLGVVLGVQHLHQSLDLHGLVGGVLVEGAHVLEDVGHLVDGVVAPLRSGAVAGDALHVHADLHAAPVAPVDAAVSGLGGHHELHLLLADALGGEELVDDVLPAHAVAVLLLHGAHHHDLVAGGNEAQILHDLGAVGGGGHAALLVGAAAAEDHRVVLVALVGIGLPVVDVADAHGVDVGVEGDDLVALAHPADDVAQAVYLHRVVAQLLHLGLDAGHHFLLLAALAGVGDHRPQEAGHIGLVALGCLLDLLVIHVRFPPSLIHRWLYFLKSLTECAPQARSLFVPGTCAPEPEPRRVARTSVLPCGQNLGAGGIQFRRAWKGAWGPTV